MAMNEDINIFEFNKMLNESKQVFEISTRLSFFDVRILNNLLLIHEIQYYCKPIYDSNGNRYDLDTVLEIVQNKLHKNVIMTTRKKIEGMCEINYYYIFLLK